MAVKPPLIILTGTTASGKSAFLYRELTDLPLVVINADSRQVYRDLRISSASPSAAEMALLPHRIYNYLKVEETFSAGRFVREATTEIAAAHAAGRVPVICGGTYFYIQSLLQGLLPETEIPAAVRRRVEALDAEAAYRQLRELDQTAADRMHMHNRVRVNRALMLCLSTGKPISALARTGGIADHYEILMLVFAAPREWLRARVADRVEQMFAAGIVAEAESIVAAWQAAYPARDWRSVPAYTGIGIQEFFAALDTGGHTPAMLTEGELSQVRQQIVNNTMHLIKRQMTWFRNAPAQPPNTKTVDPAYEHERIAALAREFLLRPYP